VGVSRDSVESHQAFKQKYGFPYTLLADTESKLFDATGSNRRSTFLFDKDGRVERVWENVTVDRHAADVLSAIT
jgi:peroxiredoxin Q/BCP